MIKRFLHTDENKVNSEIVKQENVFRKAGSTVFYMPVTDYIYYVQAATAQLFANL